MSKLRVPWPSYRALIAFYQQVDDPRMVQLLEHEVARWANLHGRAAEILRDENGRGPNPQTLPPDDAVKVIALRRAVG